MFRSWTHDQVLAEAAAWIWEPPSAAVHRSAGVVLVHYAGDTSFSPRAHVQDSERAATELVAEIDRVVSDWRLPECFWDVNDTSRPADLESALFDRGAEVVEETDILARLLCASDLGSVLVPQGLELRSATDEQTMRDAFEVAGVAFGRKRHVSDEMVRQELAHCVAGLHADSGRVVAYLDGEPVCTGGWTAMHDSGALLLWGGGCVPHARSQGAYRAVLAERLRLGASHGCSLALTRARIGTSSPILRRLGFEVHGRSRVLRLAVA